MGETTEISWCSSTFNPWLGCTNISPGCDHCYAESWSKRSGLVRWGNNPRRRTSAANWRKPLEWNEDAPRFQREHGHRQRVFCASLADWLDNQVDRQWRADLLSLIEATPLLDWLLLTKRPQNALKLVPREWFGRHNVWIGITAEDEAHYRQRWPIAAKIPAVVRFISYEPAIGPLGPRLQLGDDPTVPDWLIIGGESGGNARRMDVTWAQQARDLCLEYGVACFFKQFGIPQNNPIYRERPTQACAFSGTRRVAHFDPHGKGGSLLDGRPWKEYPTPRSTT